MSHSEVKLEKPETRGRKKLGRLEITPAKNGGHMVTHHFAGMNYSEPTMHVFGPDQGEALLAHISKHAKVKLADAMEEHELKEGED